MKKVVFILVLVLLSFRLKAQTLSEFPSIYPALIKVHTYENKGKTYIYASIDPYPATAKYGKFINDNLQYIDYLFTHFMKADISDLSNESDSIVRQQKVMERIIKDSSFHSVMSEFLSRNKKDTFSINRAASICSKFFYILKVHEDQYTFKFCIGINGIAETEDIRYPQLEAFCFNCMWNCLEGKDFNIGKETQNAIDVIKNLGLGTDDKDRLLRTQGAMYYAIYINPKLRKLLKEEYKKREKYLPFVLKF